MDETTFRILDTLSGDLSNPMTIQKLTRNIKKRHKTAHYKNIYEKVKDLETKKLLKIHKTGKDSLVTLNFQNSLLTSVLARMEHKKKETLLERGGELGMLLMELETYFGQGFAYLGSISLIKPRENLTLRRAELLFLLNEPRTWEKEGKPEGEQEREARVHNEILNIHSVMKSLRSIHQFRIDYLILRERELSKLLKEDEYTPLRYMISEQITLIHPEDYWIRLKEIVEEGGKVERTKEVHPSSISESDLAYNLEIFGYSEFGFHTKEGNRFCLEQILTSTLLKGSHRRINAIPALLAKTQKRKRKPSYNLLIFLCIKYGKDGELLGLLKMLYKETGEEETRKAVQILEKVGIKPEKMNGKAVQKYLRMYYGT